MNLREFRARYPQYEDLSDQELAAGLHKKFYSDIPFDDFLKQVTPVETPQADTGFFDMAGRAVKRGFKQTGSLLGDVLPAMVGRAVGAEDYAARQMQEAAETQREIEQKYGARYKELSDVKGAGDILPFIAETGLEQVSNLLTAVIPGVGGAVTGGRMAATAAAKKAAERGIVEGSGLATRYGALAARKGAERGGLGGAFLGSYALNAPEVFQNIYDTTKDEATGEGQMELGASLLAGSVSAALDSILPAYLVRQFTPGMKAGVVEKVLEKSGMPPGIARSATSGVITGFATEAPTEAAQEAISIAAEKFVNENADVWNSKDFNRLVESFVRGGVGGGTISGVAGGVKGYMERPRPAKPITEVDTGGSALDQIDTGEVEEEDISKKEFQAPPPEYTLTPELQEGIIKTVEGAPPEGFTDEDYETAALQQVAATETPKKTRAAPTVVSPDVKELRTKIAELNGAIKDLEERGADETVLSDWYAERERLQAQERALRRGEAPEILRAGPVEGESFKGLNIERQTDPTFGRENLIFSGYDTSAAVIPTGENTAAVTALKTTKKGTTAPGKFLLDMTAWADSNNTTLTATAAASTDEESQRLVKLYEKLGFEPDATSKERIAEGLSYQSLIRTPKQQPPTILPAGPGLEAPQLGVKRTYELTAAEKAVTDEDLKAAGFMPKEIERIRFNAKPKSASPMAKDILGRVAAGQIRVGNELKAVTQEDIANAQSEQERARLQAAFDKGEQRSLFPAQQLDLDLTPAEEGVSREFASPIELSQQEFALTAPEGIAPPAVEIQTEEAPGAAPMNLVDEYNTNRLEEMLNNLQPSVKAESGLKNYKSSIKNFIAELNEYLGGPREQRKENLGLINTFFNSLGLTSNPQRAANFARDLKGKTSAEQAQIIKQRTRMPDITTPTGLATLRKKFQDFMEQQNLAKVGEFPAAAATKTFASDIYVPAQVANLLRQLRNKPTKSMSAEEKAFMAYMTKFRYGLAMRSAAYDLASNVPMGTVFSGQGTKAAVLFKNYIEANFPPQIVEAFNETIKESKVRSKYIAEQLEKLKQMRLRRESYMRQKKAEKKEVKDFLEEKGRVREEKEKGDLKLKYAKELEALEEAKGLPKTFFDANTANSYFTPLHPAVEERIADGDVDGALELIEKFPGAKYWQLLAKRLRQANLTVTTQFDAQKRLIDHTLRDVAKTASNFVLNLQIAYPDVYEAYIKPAVNEFGEIDPTLFLKGLNAIKNQKLIGDNTVQSIGVKLLLEKYSEAVESLNAPGFYMPSQDTINLNRKRGGASYYTFFHELLHAATYDAIHNPDKLDSTQKEALDNLNKLYQYTTEKYPAVSEYGFRNLDEFIAEAFSNVKFQKLLNSLPYQNTESTLWSKFISYVRRLLGGKDTVLFGTLANADILMSSTQSRGPGTNTYTGTLNASAAPTKNYEAAPDVIGAKAWLDVLPNRLEWGAVKESVGKFLENITDATRKYYLGAFTNRQLQDLLGNRLGGTASGFINTIEDMLEDHNKIINEAKDITKIWTNLQDKNPKENDAMSMLMLDTTLRFVDPDREPGKDADLDARWNALSDEAKTVYREVRDFYARRINEYKATLLRNIEMTLVAQNVSPKEIQATLRKAELEFNKDLIAPYFPIRRFGPFWIQIGEGKNRKFMMFDSAAERNVVSRQIEAETGKKPPAGNSIRELPIKELQNLDALEKIESIIDKAAVNDPIMSKSYIGADKKIAHLRDAIKDDVQELYLLMLPNKSIRKNFLTRKGIAGASKDMLRAFSETSSRMAYQHARFKHSRTMFQQLNAAQEIQKSNAKEGSPTAKIDLDYLNELYRRLEYVMNPSNTGTLPTALSNISFIWYLTAPASALVNMLGLVAIGLPVLAARFGWIDASAMILSFFKRFMTSGFKGGDGKFEMPSLRKDSKLTAEERRAYDIFAASGLIDITQAYDLAGLAESPSNMYTGRLSTVMRWSTFLFHHAERFNREVMAMSTFKLAYEKAKKTMPEKIAFQKAINEAKDLTYRAMFDYSTLNKPRYLQNSYAKVILQFKQFPQHMTFLLAYSAFQWFSPQNAQLKAQVRDSIVTERLRLGLPDLENEAKLNEMVDEEVKRIAKEGRDRVLGTLGLTFLIAGASGLPLFSVGASVIEALYAVFSDDDEPPLNFENWFKNWTAQTFGNFWGDSISRGLFTQATGMNFADRMSLNDLWFRDARKSQDEVTAFQNMLINLLGPTAALGVSGAEAVKAFNDGHYYRGAERLLPAFFRQGLVGTRYATEGVLTMKGDELVSGSEISAKDVLSQSLGFAPEKVAQKQKANIEKKTMEQDILSKRQDLLNAFFMSVDTQNDDLLDRTLDKIARFNRMYPSDAITSQTLSKSIKTRYKARALAEISGGVPINKKLMAELEDMGYYGDLD